MNLALPSTVETLHSIFVNEKKKIYFEGKAFEVEKMNQEKFICRKKSLTIGKEQSADFICRSSKVFLQADLSCRRID